ncbi:MAG TPA: transglutaminase domain-containing protein, partial [Kofleriaceae bacterium]|nr:transglutaminase domain-containing protein [Kofleriaceae bacterium]
MRQPRTRTVILSGIVVAAAGLALAQTQQVSHRVLHEDLPSPSEKPQPTIGGGNGSNPTAIIAGDKRLPKPVTDAPAQKPKDGEPVLGAGGFAADRQTSMKPDGNTGPDSTLHYASVFNPDVIPFKRMSVLDGVADDYTLRVARAALTEIAVGGTNDKARDRFWGSVLLQLTPGADVALPSVAPDMRILSYEIQPKLAVKFEKDGADNFYVRTDEAGAAGTYRLVFLADADAGYFAPSLPQGGRFTPRVIQTMTPPELRPQLPAAVARQAKVTLDRLQIDADMDLGVVFNKLVGYFRGFEAKALPRNTGDIYRDLCDTQAGVCRHRAFAFMITADAIGIPTRFVENEAHAFVEVWFPTRGWQRIDLGGAALRM